MLRIGLLLLCLPCVYLMWVSTQDWSMVSACLDQGKGFDYQNEVCSSDQTLKPIPFMQRHPVLVNSMMLTALLGFVVCLVGLYQKRR